MKNRSGAYKKLLLSSALLAQNSAHIKQCLSEIDQQVLSETEVTTLYILLYLRIKHPKNWLQNLPNIISSQNNGNKLLEVIPCSFKLNEWEKLKLKDVTSYDLFLRFNLKGIPLSINRTMMKWLDGVWKIKMLTHIPNSRELLKLQVKNTRCITLITDPEKCSELVLGTRDPLSFVLHDLMHADQFFSQKESLIGQLGFYQLLESIYDQPLLRTLLRSDSVFKREFEYVASDMNAYVIHLLKCLKSAIERTDLKSVLFKEMLLWWNMDDDLIHSALKLNTPEFGVTDELKLKLFFESKQEFFK